MAKSEQTPKKTKPETLSDKCGAVLKQRREHLTARRMAVSLVSKILMVTLVFFILLTQILQFSRARNNDMYPAIRAGDIVLGYRLGKEFEKNDVVVFQQGEYQRVGRIVAKGGDTVTLDESGALLVNGTLQYEKIPLETLPCEYGTITYPYTVPSDSYFILNDYRQEQRDSREFGPVKASDIQSRVISLLRRREI